ncbi:MAG: phosphopantetheine-binding protein [Acidobacteriota bacterium]
MNREEIRSKIKEIIATVADLDPGDIADSAHFFDDLSLDSLSLLEIGVDLDYEFRLAAPDLDERIKTVQTMPQAVELVATMLEEKNSRAEVA